MMGAREKYIKGLITHCKVFILKKKIGEPLEDF